MGSQVRERLSFAITDRRRSQTRSPRRWIGLLAVHLILACGAIVMVVPFAWMLITTIKTLGESTQIPPVVFPAIPQWQNYAAAVSASPFLDFYRNTIIMTLGRVLGQLAFCSLAGYAFARLEFPGRRFLFVGLLALLMVPSQLPLIPQYLLMNQLGWLNTEQALIVPGMFSVFGTFLLRQFFLTLPREMDEAARLDGANHLQIYWHVMLPLVKPGLIALAILTALWSWNDLLWPLIVIDSPTRTTLSAGLATLQGEHGTNYPVLMAGTTLAIWPMVLLFLVLQRRFVEGIAVTGLNR